MWWTQPKLALIVLAVNGCVVLTSSLLLPASAALTGAILVAQATLLAAYVTTARRLGRRHLAGSTRSAFDARIWNKSWGRPADGFEYATMHQPAGDASGRSFYRHVLGSATEMHESLYGALSLWEGTRLMWVGEAISLAVALVAGTLMLEVVHRLQVPGGAPAWVAASLLPVCVLLLPEAAKILLLKRRLLRRGAVDRIAALAPREAVDLGFQAEQPVLPAEFRRDVAWTSLLFLGVPLVLVVALAAGPRIAAFGTVALTAAVAVLVALFSALRGFVVHRIPFITFVGPLEVSVALDLAHRRRAWLSFAMLLGLGYVALLVGPMNDPADLAPSWPTFYWLGYITAITFGDQLAGYAGFGSAANFEACLNRSMAKLRTGTPGTP